MKKILPIIVILLLVACNSSEKTTNYEEFVKSTVEISTDIYTTTSEPSIETTIEETTDELSTEATKITNDLNNDGLITFRNIPWYSTKLETEKILHTQGAKVGGWMSRQNNIYRMNATNYSNVTSAEDRVDGGGYYGWYTGISVAGYDVKNMYACYMYPIENGNIVYSDEKAQFYFGWYSFSENDYSDCKAINDDLKSKLSTLYGKGEEKSNKYNTTIIWKDKNENQIRLLINTDKTYVTLGYMAADADKHLDELQKYLENEKLTKESENREKNKDVIDGL